MPLDLATSARRLADTLSVERTARSLTLPFWLRHLLALLIVLAALAIRLLLDPLVGPAAVPFVIFNAAIALSAFFWGRSPGITATLASALLCNFFVMPPRHVFHLSLDTDLAPMLFFIATGLTVSILAGHLYSSRLIAHQRHQLLSVTLASIGDAVIVADALGNVSYLNTIAEQLTGWSAADARGRKLSEVFRIINETTRQPIESPADKVLQSGAVVGLSNHTLLLARDGREIPIDDSGAPIRQDDGSIHGVILVFRDFTDRRRRELDIQRLNRLLKARSASSRALLHATDEIQYLQDVCRLVVEDCGYVMGWIGFAQNDDAKSIVPMASAGTDEGYLQTLNLTWADAEHGRGPTGTAIRTGQVNRCPNMLDDPHFAPWRQQALRRGYASSIALPLLHDGKAFACLTLYSSLPDPFTPDEVRLLEELAGDLAHGIDTIRLRAAHARAQESLRAGEERLRFALESMQAGAWEFDLATHVAQRSLQHDHIFGYDALPPQWSFEMFLQHVIPEDRTWVEPEIRNAIAAGHGWDFECRIIRADGAQRWIWVCGQLYGTVSGKLSRAVGIVLDITDRKTAEEQFRLYLNVLQAAANAIVITDPNGIVQWVNPAFTRLTGYSAAEALGNNPRVLNSKHHDDAFFKNMWQTILAGRVWQGEVVNRRKDDATYIEEMTITPVTDASGQIAHFIAIKQDITHRKRAEESLRRSEARWNAAIESFAEGAIIATEDEQIIYWNPAARAMYGFTGADAFIGSLENASVLFQLWTPDGGRPLDFDEWPMRRIKRGETLRNLELRIRRPDQRWEKVFSYSGTMVDTASGERLIFLTCHDLTELRDAEAALRQSREDLDRAQAVGQIGWWRLDTRRNVLTWSDENYRIFGIPKGTPLTYETFLATVHPDDRRHVAAQWQAGLRGEPYELEHRIVVAGQTKWIREKAYLEFDRQGELLGGFGISQDISERKHAEQALARTADELARSNHDLEQFAYVASHDLQEPLRMVTGYLQLLDRRYKDLLDQDARDFINFAVDGASRMSRLITDLLDFSRINTRGKPPQPVALDNVLQQARENLHFALNESGAQIVAGPPEPLPTVRGDATQLVQLFQNLLGNAIKFRAPDRPQRIYIQAERTDDKWRISVADQGIGLDPQYAEKIFLIFQRLHSRAEYPGTGIGLALCKRIVERHGGKIWVEGCPGKGATFFFTLPAA